VVDIPTPLVLDWPLILDKDENGWYLTWDRKGNAYWIHEDPTTHAAFRSTEEGNIRKAIDAHGIYYDRSFALAG
jgi:hypothetical protein